MNRYSINILALIVALITLTAGAAFAQPTTSTSPAPAMQPAPAAAGMAKGAVVNVNTATAQELSTLYRVGPKLAAAIIAYREKNGPFKSVDDLTKVMRVGKKIVDQNRSRLTVK
jgi:competence protein ComEA